MGERPFNWRMLTEHPTEADGQHVNLVSKISGTLIESFGVDRGVNTSLSVHRAAPEYFDVQTNIKVHAFLPGEFSDIESQALMLARNVGGCIIVEGRFEYDPQEDYIGRVRATSYKTI